MAEETSAANKRGKGERRRSSELGPARDEIKKFKENLLQSVANGESVISETEEITVPLPSRSRSASRARDALCIPPNVLAELDENKVFELKEAFLLFDMDGDGCIDYSDLKATLISLGTTPDENVIRNMLAEAPNPLDFDGFVNLLGYKTLELDSEETLMSALSRWDKDNSGLISEESMSSWVRWALSSYSSSGLGLASVAVVLILVPVQYYAPPAPSPALAEPLPALAEPLPAVAEPLPALAEPLPTWLEHALSFPTLDLFLTGTFILLVSIIYLSEWIQRKILERRIVKLNKCLCASVKRLREWDQRQKQLEDRLQQLRSATSEYNLLLYLLLRQHGYAPLACREHSLSNMQLLEGSMFDKLLDDAPLIDSDIHS